jgi:hypothetical protein
LLYVIAVDAVQQHQTVPVKDLDEGIGQQKFFSLHSQADQILHSLIA